MASVCALQHNESNGVVLHWRRNLSGEVVVELEGVVRNGVIVPDSDSPLPEGTRVRITAPVPPPTVWEKLRQLAEKYENEPCDLPEDLALNHDHYLYGTPKRP
jgi:hypothetical protein